MEAAPSYVILDRITPALRMAVSLALIAAGYILQLSTHNILAGLPFVILCMVMNLLKNVKIRAEQAEELKWEEVTAAKVTQAAEQCRRIMRFRSANIGCVIGLLVAVVWFSIVALPAFRLPIRFSALLFDGVILFAGLALSGRRSAWLPNALNVKTSIVQRILQSPLAKDPEAPVLPYLEIGRAKSGGFFPNDARLMVRFPGAPEDFIGIQFQISINNVKGAQYPYLYAVILAKTGFKLFEKFKDPELPNTVMENEETDEVDVIVIRQFTTRTSGYHTDAPAQDRIVAGCIQAVKKMLAG